MGVSPPPPISHFQSQSEKTIVTIGTPVQKTPQNKPFQGWRRGVTMGVTVAWDRHPAAESGPGITPMRSPGASEVRGRPAMRCEA